MSTPRFPGSPYVGRRVALASLHGKERALARPLRAALGLELQLAAGVDTDRLGTFSGEVERPADAEETCRRKAALGMEATGLPLGLASEGSFGPHPQIPFLPAGMEWLSFVDAERGLVIGERLLARRTNFDHRSAARIEDLGDWPEQVGFPSHALIVRPHQPAAGVAPTAALRKGLRHRTDLAEAIALAALASGDGLALVETDMRAHMNPTRMAAIRHLAFRLVRRIASPCPRCASPGWGRIDVRTGLPCRSCGTPTALVAREVHGCVACSHTEERPRADGLSAAEPGHCPWCNP